MNFWYFPVATGLLSAYIFMLFAAPRTYLAWRAPPALGEYRI